MDAIKGLLPFLKKYYFIVIVLVAGVVLMLLPSSSNSNHTQAVIESPGSNILSLEERLEVILSQISGAGRVEVMLSVDREEEVVYQTDTRYNSDGSLQSHDTVTFTDAQRSESGLVRTVIKPTYLGAVVICAGADSPSVRLAVTEAVANATGLSADKISVLKMK